MKGRELSDRSHNQSTEWSADVAAKALVIVCAWNLNGVLWLTLGVDQAVSFIMLVASAYLIAKCGRIASLPLTLLIAALCSYLLFATIFAGPQTQLDPQSTLYISYAGTILLIWGVTGYVAALSQYHRAKFLCFVRNALVIAAISVWISPILYQYYVNIPLSASQRMGGFFVNPNEAAYVSLLALAFTLYVPYPRGLINTAVAALAVGAVVLTLSKTGMSTLVLVLGLYFVRKARGWGVFVLIFSTLIAFALAQDLRWLFSAIVEQPLFEFSSFEKARILAVADILQGQIDDQTSTGRTVVWNLAFDRAWSNFPFGSGLGSGHFLVGGILENNVWQGAHNVFLMMWVESGVVPLLLVVASAALAVFTVFRDRRPPLELTCMLILVAQMLAGHTALSTRYHNLALAIMLGLQATTVRRTNLTANIPHVGAPAVSTRPRQESGPDAQGLSQ